MNESLKTSSIFDTHFRHSFSTLKTSVFTFYHILNFYARQKQRQLLLRIWFSESHFFSLPQFVELSWLSSSSTSHTTTTTTTPMTRCFPAQWRLIIIFHHFGTMSASSSTSLDVGAPPTRRWSCVNKHKNEPLTILFHCTWSGKEFPVPTDAEHINMENNYYDEPNGDEESILLGSVTLKDSVKRLKAREPALFLMEECGGIEMHCGNNTV
jgi:hypothetical protein